MPSVAEGDPCPPFDLPEDGEGRASLESLAGAPFVLFAYPKADTSGCTLEAGDFSRLGPDFTALGIPVIGLSPDPLAALQAFRAKHGLTVRLASDVDRALIEALGLWAEKSMYGKTTMGVERTTLLVDGSGRVARVWPKVSVPGHADAVLEAARALG